MRVPPFGGDDGGCELPLKNKKTPCLRVWWTLRRKSEQDGFERIVTLCHYFVKSFLKKFGSSEFSVKFRNIPSFQPAECVDIPVFGTL